MRLKSIVLAVAVLVFASLPASAKIIHVPGDSSTIQSGINGAVNGDTVLVAPGEYFENINFMGEGILVASNYIFNPSSSIVDSTIISGLGPKVTFGFFEDSTSAIKGFSIIGFPTPLPGTRGIVCYNSSPTIVNNIIRENTVSIVMYERGAGIYCDNSNPFISHNVIKDNIACWGAGIYLANYSHPIIEENLIEHNYTASGMFMGSGAGICSRDYSIPVIRNNIIRWNGVDAGGGGGISCDSAIISNNVILGNTADLGAGISCGPAIITNNTILKNAQDGIASGSAVITNNIIAENGGEGIGCSMGSTPIISYNNVWNNAGGNFSNCDPNLGLLDTVNANDDSCDVFFNISYDPLFADTLLHLSSASPCMEAGYNKAQGLFGFDLDGEPRVMDGDSNAVITVDIGADEFPGVPPFCANVNGDGVINIADVVYLVNYLFRSGYPPQCPPEPYTSCADANGDGQVGLPDVVYLINYLLKSGPDPIC